MSLFDSVVGSVMGGLTGNSAPGGASNEMLHAAMGLIQQQGGISAVLQKFQQGGLAQEAASWLGNGQNLPISPAALQSVLGSGAISSIASKFGLPADQVSSTLAALVPHVIDKLTPTGAVAGDHEQLLQQGMSALAAAFGNKPAAPPSA
ncbi:MAG: YidB family protein [Stenotrophobium sp.]